MSEKTAKNMKKMKIKCERSKIRCMTVASWKHDWGKRFQQFLLFFFYFFRKESFNIFFFSTKIEFKAEEREIIFENIVFHSVQFEGETRAFQVAHCQANHLIKR